MKEKLLQFLRIPALLLGLAFLALGLWMAVVAKDLYFCFYSLLIGALLLRYAIKKPAVSKSENR